MPLYMGLSFDTRDDALLPPIPAGPLNSDYIMNLHVCIVLDMVMENLLVCNSTLFTNNLTDKDKTPKLSATDQDSKIRNNCPLQCSYLM